MSEAITTAPFDPLQHQGTLWLYRHSYYYEICRNNVQPSPASPLACPAVVTLCSVSFWPVKENFSGITIEAPLNELSNPIPEWFDPERPGIEKKLVVEVDLKTPHTPTPAPETPGAGTPKAL